MSLDLADRGFLLGDGLFETLLWARGDLILFEAHAARLQRGCAVLGLPAPEASDLEAAATGAVTAAGLSGGRAAVRLTWTAGAGGRGLDRPASPDPRLVASAASAPPPGGAVRLARVEIRRNEGSPASRCKTLAYLDNVLARAAARKSGADEALMLNNRGELACAAAANLFWLRGQVLFTPALDCGVLDGVMRARVLEAARDLGLETREARCGVEALAGADGLFLTNSLIGIAPVSTLDGVGFPGSVWTDRLCTALAHWC